MAPAAAPAPAPTELPTLTLALAAAAAQTLSQPLTTARRLPGFDPAPTSPCFPPAVRLSAKSPDSVAFLDGMGRRIGWQVAERLTVGRERFRTELDAVRWVCRDLWREVFGAQVDNLKTNHQGTYILGCRSFRPLRRVSGPRGEPEAAAAHAGLAVRVPAALVRGALAALGVDAAVSAETAPPGAVFRLEVVQRVRVPPAVPTRSGAAMRAMVGGEAS